MTKPDPLPRVKTAYCRYCLQPRFPEEIVLTPAGNGQKRRRCVHCMPPARKPIPATR